jgi:hypothetical protein
MAALTAFASPPPRRRVADVKDDVGNRRKIKIVVALIERQVPCADGAPTLKEQPSLVPEIYFEETSVVLAAAGHDCRCPRSRDGRTSYRLTGWGRYEVPGLISGARRLDTNDRGSLT